MTVVPVLVAGGLGTETPAGVDGEAVVHGVQEQPPPVVRQGKPTKRYDAYFSGKVVTGLFMIVCKTSL